MTKHQQILTVHFACNIQVISFVIIKMFQSWKWSMIIETDTFSMLWYDNKSVCHFVDLDYENIYSSLPNIWNNRNSKEVRSHCTALRIYKNKECQVITEEQGIEKVAEILRWTMQEKWSNIWRLLKKPVLLEREHTPYWSEHTEIEVTDH